MVKKLSTAVYALLLIGLLGLFFTNDFGLIDIHKTSFIVAVAVDTDGDEVQTTAQIAVPQPSQSGDAIEYIEVQGSGYTVADALNEINAKTGTYPKLHFCKLILIGDSCKDKPLFEVLGCFYRRNYSELTALVAMCEGSAQEMLKRPATIDPENSTAIQKVLSDELKRSANLSKSDLKSIAESNYSVSRACYMPYIEVNAQGTSKRGGEGDNAGGEKPKNGEQQKSGESSSGGNEKAKSGGESETVEFAARRTAIFNDGKFSGILDERQAFALNLVKNEVRLAVIPCIVGEINYTIGLRGVDGKVDFKVKQGVPTLTIGVSATAQVQGIKSVIDPKTVYRDDVVPQDVLDGVKSALEERFKNLLNTSIKTDCDLLGIKKLLHKFNYKYYDAFKDDVLRRMKINYDIKIVSLN